jgi:hypothetical protein
MIKEHCDSECTRGPHFAQPDRWLRPVTGPGWLGLVQNNKKIKNKNFCMYKYAKNKINLLVYSLTPESGIKILM